MTRIINRYKIIRISSLLITSLFFLLLMTGLTTASTMPVTGHLANGPSFDVVETGGFLFAGQGGEIRGYDVSSGSNISGLGWEDYVSRLVIGNPVYGLKLDSELLHVASENKYLIVDISQPDSPNVISVYTPKYPLIAIRDVELVGDYAYLAIGGVGIQVMDISDKNHPVPGKLVPLGESNRPWRLCTDGSYLYAAMESDNRLDILSLEDPKSPVIVGSYTAGQDSSFSSVAVEGSYAYVTEYHNGIRVINVADPGHPVEVSNVLGVNANDIKILNHLAYVSVRYQGFDIYDLSSPGKLALVGRGTETRTYNEGIFPTSTHTFLAAESSGVAIYDTSLVTSPKMLVMIPLVSGVDSVISKGNYLYIGGHNLGLWVVDVSNKTNPTETAFINIGGRNMDLDISGDHLLAAGGWNGLSVIDIKNPAAPKVLIEDYGPGILTLYADGNLVYTSQGIVDVSNHQSPVYLYKGPEFAGKFAKYRENYLIVADDRSEKGLRIINISDPRHPVLVTSYDTGISYKDVVTYGSTAYTLTGQELVALDLSDIRSPNVLVKTTYGTGYGLEIEGSVVYVVGGESTVAGYDVSNPMALSRISTASVPENAPYLDIDSSEGYLYTGNKWGAYVIAESGNEGKFPNDEPPPATQKVPFNKLLTIIAIVYLVIYRRAKNS